jgi:hypothetical protein
MNKFILIFLFFNFLFTSCNESLNNTNSKEIESNESEDEKRIAIFIKPKQINLKKENLDYLKRYNNQYAFDFDLLKNPKLKERIIQLIGNENFKFMDDLTGSTPAELKNNRFSCWIYKAHDACCNHSIIDIDFKKNILYVGICINHDYKLYSEDGSSSEKLKEWCFCQ